MRGASGLALLVAGFLGVLSPASAAPVISEIRSSPAGGKVGVQIVASDRLSYAVVETREPFRLILYLPDAAFAFPLAPLQLKEGPLVAVVPAQMKREDGTLGRIDLTFAQDASYTLTRDGTTLTVTVDLPTQGGQVTLFGGPPPAVPTHREVHPPPTTTALAAPTPPAPPKETTVDRLGLAVAGEVTTVRVDGSGPLTYRVTTMTAPHRLVVDLPRAIYRPRKGQLAGQGPVVTRIRISQFLENPEPVVRIVLDLTRPVPYRIEDTGQGLLIHADAGPQAKP